MSKEKTEPININHTLKNFITDMKNKLKIRTKKFYSTPNTLLYYLKDSEKFCDDYSKYCEENGIENDLFPNRKKFEKTKKIMEYEKEDNLYFLQNNNRK